MSEQRLIDGNELHGIESLLNTDIIQASKEASWLMSQVLHDIDAMPTIDPESLPIVRELREKLERVTAERDALKQRLAKHETTFKKENPELAKFLAEHKTAVNACELCKALANDLRALPMCENGDPCPLHLDGDHL